MQLTGEPQNVEGELWAVEIDAEKDAAEYIEKIKEDAKDSVSIEVQPTVEQHLDLAKNSPGTEESALFDRFVDLIALSPDEYDRIVFDTAPTGHTLRLLTLPALLTAWAEGMVRQREKVAGMERMMRNLAGSDERRKETPSSTASGSAGISFTTPATGSSKTRPSTWSSSPSDSP